MNDSRSTVRILPYRDWNWSPVEIVAEDYTKDYGEAKLGFVLGRERDDDDESFNFVICEGCGVTWSTRGVR